MEQLEQPRPSLGVVEDDGGLLRVAEPVDDRIIDVIAQEPDVLAYTSASLHPLEQQASLAGAAWPVDQPHRDRTRSLGPRIELRQLSLATGEPDDSVPRDQVLRRCRVRRQGDVAGIERRARAARHDLRGRIHQCLHITDVGPRARSLDHLGPEDDRYAETGKVREIEARPPAADRRAPRRSRPSRAARAAPSQ